MFESVGSFAPLWAEWMKAYRPRKFAQLERSGRAVAEARRFESQASLALRSLVAELKRRNPPPPTYLDAVQHDQNLRAMAREQIIADLLASPDLAD